jgi:hypothetical protein
LAELHPEIQTLLSGLLQSGLAPLAAVGINRIQADTFERDGPVTDAPDLPEWSRVLHQVGHIHAAISVPLKREIEMMHRLRTLAETLELESVAVLPPERQQGASVEGRSDDLLSEAREAAIRAFLQAWLPAVDTVRTRWERRRDGG